MEPHFKQVTFIGMGIMAGSLSLAFRKHTICERYVGISRDETIEKALSLKLIDDGFTYDKMKKGVEGSSLVILCSPIRIIIKHIEELGKAVEPGTVVTDVGSTKGIIMETARAAFRKDTYFVGGHPMAGSELSGVPHSNAGIFQNKAYILVPGDDTPEWIIEKLTAIIKIIGSFPVILSADVHDRIVAAVSHLPQIISIALMNTAGMLDSEKHEHLKLSGSGLSDMTRIASSQFSIWKDICETNEENIKDSIDLFMREMEKLKSMIGKENLGGEFEKSNGYRKLFNTIRKK